MLRISEAAEFLSVTPATIRRWCDRGLMPYSAKPSDVGDNDVAEAALAEVGMYG